MNYSFAWPQPNKNVPCSCVRSGTLIEATKAALKFHGSSLHGCTILSEGKIIGKLFTISNGAYIETKNKERINVS